MTAGTSLQNKKCETSTIFVDDESLTSDDIQMILGIIILPFIAAIAIYCWGSIFGCWEEFIVTGGKYASGGMFSKGVNMEEFKLTFNNYWYIVPAALVVLAYVYRALSLLATNWWCWVDDREDFPENPICMAKLILKEKDYASGYNSTGCDKEEYLCAEILGPILIGILLFGLLSVFHFIPFVYLIIIGSFIGTSFAMKWGRSGYKKAKKALLSIKEHKADKNVHTN